jgi:hypothetical protein
MWMDKKCNPIGIFREKSKQGIRWNCGRNVEMQFADHINIDLFLRN